MKRALIAGPCISEFGWEVMEWQGYVRKQAEGCDRVIVCSRPHMQPLYADIPGLVFIPHAIRAEVTTHKADIMHTPDVMQECTELLDTMAADLEARGCAVSRLEVPRSGLRFGSQFEIDGSQVYRRFGRKPPKIILHIRNKQYTTGSEPNYPAKLWRQIIGRLVARYGGPVAAVGTGTDALCLPPCDDYRDIPLDRLCDLMAGADIAIGPSSGPMHLASLCGCPHVVWTEREATADRYLRGWNPFGTPACALIQERGKWIESKAVIDAVAEIIGDETTGAPDECGVCYVCVGDDYCSLMEASIESLRTYYTGPIAVVTDYECPHIEEMAVRYKLQVINAPAPKGAGQHTRSRWIKTSLYEWTPYRITAYLDCDTIICGNIAGIFHCLSDKASIALTTETGCATIGSRGWRQTTEAERDETLALCGPDSPHWHSSTMVFRRSAAARGLFRRWHAEWLRYGMQNPQGRVQDQPALARALALSGGPGIVATLPKRYNRRSRRDGRGDCFDCDTVVYSVRPAGGDFDRAKDRLLSLAARKSGAVSEPFGEPIDVPKPTRKPRRRGDK
jgi:hypothetical protein